MTKDYKAFVLCRSKKYKRVISAMIARALGAYRVTAGYNPRFFPGPGSLLINYGVSTTPIWWDRLDESVKILNQPSAVKNSVNKMRTTACLYQAGLPFLPTTEHRDEAQHWLDSGEIVYCRTLTSGSKGQGIVIAGPLDTLQTSLVDAPMYTRGMDNMYDWRTTIEYRVHVINGEVVDRTQKRRMTRDTLEKRGWEVPNDPLRNMVRTWRNGWVFARNNLQWHDRLDTLAVRALEACGMDWGCVDILTHWDDGGPADTRVVEVNSAPGIDAPGTFTKHIDYFKQLMED